MSVIQKWTFRAHGDAFALTPHEDAPARPQDLGPRDVMVRIEAVSLNYRDLIAWKNLAGRKVDGRVPTSDGSGTVVAVGSEVSQWKVGDRLAGCFFPKWQSGPFDLSHHLHDLGGNLDGMLRRVVVMDENSWVRIPNHLTTREASTLPCAGVTAWYALTERGKLHSGQSVLALGTGGVSVFALQIAHVMGATLAITSSDDQKLERARALGASFGVNYKTQPKWSEEVWTWTQGRGVDHIIEVGGPGTLEQSIRCVAGGGHIALIGVLTGFVAPTASLFPLQARNATLSGIYVGPRDAFQAFNAFLETHRIHPIIDRTFAFSEVPEAFAYLASGRHFGKVVIEIDPSS